MKQRGDIMEIYRKILSILFPSLLLFFSSVALPKDVIFTDAESTDYGIRNPRVENGVTTYDRIRFGSYYQNADVHDAEPIKWRVLSVDGNDAFLLADKNLDWKQYNDKYNSETTWEKCTLRKWLNEDFYDTVFSEDEKKAILNTTVKNEDNPYSPYIDEDGGKGGKNTKDKVYLLSVSETMNEAYGFTKKFNKNTKTRAAKNTDYAKLNNAESSPEDKTAGNGRWWLRTPGEWNGEASYIDESGYGSHEGLNVYLECAVRPVIHINLSASKVESAGRVDSEGNIIPECVGINNPVVKDSVTTWDCVYFGNYMGCNFEKQALEWRVLSVDGDDAFLLAEKNIDCKPYNEKNENATWEKCTLRKWLNEDFYNAAFSEEEKKAILTTNIINKDNSDYNTEGGNNTYDNIFLLSIEEAVDKKYGFDTQLYEEEMEEIFVRMKTREAENTEYSKINNAYGMNYDDETTDNGCWWLRSPGDESNRAVNVYYDGSVYSNGDELNEKLGVRPALHMNLSLSTWSKADEVSEEWGGIDYEFDYEL